MAELSGWFQTYTGNVKHTPVSLAHGASRRMHRDTQGNWTTAKFHYRLWLTRGDGRRCILEMTEQEARAAIAALESYLLAYAIPPGAEER